jgi:hypothetical protein
MFLHIFFIKIGCIKILELIEMTKLLVKDDVNN